MSAENPISKDLKFHTGTFIVLIVSNVVSSSCKYLDFVQFYSEITFIYLNYYEYSCIFDIYEEKAVCIGCI
jgi:hypothetical protein